MVCLTEVVCAKMRQLLLRKLTYSPEKGPFQKESNLPTTIFQGACWFSGDYITYMRGFIRNFYHMWNLSDSMKASAITTHHL